jgi:hypothetical protein
LPSTGWALIDNSIDVGGSIISDASTIATCGPSIGGSSWQYSYSGNLNGSATITFVDSNGPQVPCYQLRVIFWMILIDNWQGSDQIRVTLNGNQIQTMNRNNRLTN